MTPPLEAQIRKTHEARCRLAVAKGMMAGQLRPELPRDLGELYDDAEAAVHAEEDLLREMAIACYRATGQEQPGPGISIKVHEKREWNALEGRFIRIAVVPHVTLAEDLGHALDREAVR